MVIYLQILIELNSVRSLPVCSVEKTSGLKPHHLSREPGSLQRPASPPQPGALTHTWKRGTERDENAAFALTPLTHPCSSE